MKINLTLFFLIAICLGSFINVIRYRLPRNESIVFPPSHCDNCKKDIPWFYNIPVISWTYLRGRCAFCNYKIPYSYVVVELLVPVIFIFNIRASFNFSNSFFSNLIGTSIFSIFLIIISLIDLDNLFIPNKLIFFGVIIGYLYFGFVGIFLNSGNFILTISYNFISGLIGFLLLEIITFLISIVIKKQAFGMGDSKYLFFLGSWLGLKGMLLSFALSIYVGGIASAFLLILRRITRKQKIPFGPYLSIGAYLVIFFGEEFWMHILKSIYF